MGKKLKLLLFGGAVGATLGVLYAPRSGKQTRAKLAEKTEALWGEEAQQNGTFLGEVAKTTKTAVGAGQDIIQQTSQSFIGETARDVAEKGQDVVKGTTDKFVGMANENVKPVFQKKNDELRAKIDEARKKIASQVATNIDEQAKKEQIKENQAEVEKIKEVNNNQVVFSQKPETEEKTEKDEKKDNKPTKKKEKKD